MLTGSGPGYAVDEEAVDPDFEKEYGEAARAQGMTIRQYLNQLQGYAEDEL